MISISDILFMNFKLKHNYPNNYEMKLEKQVLSGDIEVRGGGGVVTLANYQKSLHYFQSIKSTSSK